MTRPKVKSFTWVTGKKYDGMMSRCYRHSDISYKHYGYRGIKVCSEWIKDINQFRVWLAAELELMNISQGDFVQFSSKYQLDRIDVNGHYSPANCRLVDAQTNTRNSRRKKLEVISAEGERIVI